MPVEIPGLAPQSAAEQQCRAEMLPCHLARQPQKQTAQHKDKENQIGRIHDCPWCGAVLPRRSQPAMPVLHGPEETARAGGCATQYPAAGGINQQGTFGPCRNLGWLFAVRIQNRCANVCARRPPDRRQELLRRHRRSCARGSEIHTATVGPRVDLTFIGQQCASHAHAENGQTAQNSGCQMEPEENLSHGRISLGGLVR